MTSQIEIRFAGRDDEAKIIEFLREHWRDNHIFVTNPEVLRWQHKSPDVLSQSLTFILAEELGGAESDGLIALLGFIPLRRFDPEAVSTEIALAIWRAREADAGVPGLGILLLKRLQRDLQPDMIVAVGISPMVRPIYRALGFEVSALSHWALFKGIEAGPCLVALGVPPHAMRNLHLDAGVELKAIVGESLPAGIDVKHIDALGRTRTPQKSWRYIVNRFVRHPWFNYELRGVVVDGKTEAVLVWRKVEAPSGVVLRIVDIVGNGDALARCGGHLRNEVADARAEYIDVMQWGMSPDALRTGGFVGCEDYPDMVLPSRFAPFEPQNAPVEIAFKLAPSRIGSRVQLFRADSDQDRPNHPLELQGK